LERFLQHSWAASDKARKHWQRRRRKPASLTRACLLPRLGA
jgi:hypothetical protein